MESDICGIQRTESQRRIAVDVDLAELDLVAAMLPMQRVIESRGFTVNELADHSNISRVTSQRHVSILVKQGKIRQIGVRPGHGGGRVYEVVK